MTSTTIGFLSFKANPQKSLAPMRLRALHVEALLQGATFSILDWSDFSRKNDHILTWYWSPNGWKSERKTLPDIVIIVSYPLNDKQQQLFEWITETRTYINDIGAGKIDLPHLLSNTTYKNYIIPYAEIYNKNSTEIIKNFLKIYGNSVVKRDDGNRGVGHYFIFNEGSDWYIKNSKKNFFAIADVADEIVGRIQGRLAYRNFLIQKYIKSTAADGRAADIRVHVQRGSDQTWSITRSYTRLAEVGSLTANVSLGGYQGPLTHFLALRKNRPAIEIEAEMAKAALEIAEIESAAAPRPLSELGIDFLLDEEDKIWLTEINTYPETSLHEHERAINTIGYALSLIKKA